MQINGNSAQNPFRKRSEFGSNTPSTYRIRVIGEVDVSSLDSIRSLEISSSGKGKKQITTLTGFIPDQAALFNILHALYDMRLPLVSVLCFEEAESPL